ncbi:transposase [Limosilactobacillus agrestis]|uniref:transposase n=1 Tax=Limosilactobacillus agrestis TaxID=2759748 RepID=UPI0039E12BC7
MILQLSFNYLNFGQDSVSHYTIQRCRVLARYKEEIKRGFETKFSNGRTEGINNRIKPIKRVACGYRYFTVFKTRIYLIIGQQIQTN